MCSVYSYNGMLFNLKKEWNPVICDNMGDTGHYAKWNKPDTGKQILTTWSYLHVKSQKNQTHRNRVEWWLPGTGGRGNGEMLVKGKKLQLCIMNKC